MQCAASMQVGLMHTSRGQSCKETAQMKLIKPITLPYTDIKRHTSLLKTETKTFPYMEMIDPIIANYMQLLSLHN